MIFARSPLMRLMMSGGVPRGATSAHQTLASKPGTPASIMVGTSGSAPERCGPVTASGRNFPALICGMAGTMSENTIWICPATRSVTAWMVPLYGICTMFTPTALLYISPLICDWMPLPPEPKLSWPGLAFSRAVNSATVLAAIDGCTTSTWPAAATIEIGAKSLIGSKPSRL